MTLINNYENHEIELQITMRVLINDKFFSSKIEEHELSIIEISETHLVVSVADKNFASGQNVEISLNIIENPQSKFSIKFITLISDVQAAEDNHSNLKLKLKLKIDNALTPKWNRFLGIYSKRQNEILQFLKDSKGY